ncbi:glutaminyl-peptide cyclotransferase [Aestuariivirga sp.]|uniref:glutaminyl-peptide cyclotransferase n=1 Tax=Aestuariivirga sp. TaxID=2650926 RepID=UPI003BA9890C
MKIPSAKSISRRKLLGAGLATALMARGGSGAALADNTAPFRAHVELTRRRVLDQHAIPVHGYKITNTFPHDRTSYTEGLVMVDGAIIEGTGLYGQSRLLHWDPASGRQLNEIALQRDLFGEGIAVLDGVIHQLTYIENVRFTYDLKSFARTGQGRCEAQGWGMTQDGSSLITSNGSSAISFRNPTSFEIVKTIYVSDETGPVGFLNELEYANGVLYANVWQTEFIVQIDPATGRVIGWINLAGLNPEPQVLVYPLVLNGIAYDDRSGRLLVTGKCWPHLYEIEVLPA